MQRLLNFRLMCFATALLLPFVVSANNALARRKGTLILTPFYDGIYGGNENYDVGGSYDGDGKIDSFLEPGQVPSQFQNPEITSFEEWMASNPSNLRGELVGRPFFNGNDHKGGYSSKSIDWNKMSYYMTPWNAKKLKMMMSFMQEMNKTKNVEQENGSDEVGILPKILSDPLLLFLAFAIPLSFLFASLLPIFLNNSVGSGIPVFSSTASGRSLYEDASLFIPILDAIESFGNERNSPNERSSPNERCIQRVFCYMTTSGNEGLRKMFISTTSKLLGTNWMTKFGVKDLIEAIKDGNCENIPCSSSYRNGTMISN